MRYFKSLTKFSFPCEPEMCIEIEELLRFYYKPFLISRDFLFPFFGVLEKVVVSSYMHVS